MHARLALRMIVPVGPIAAMLLLGGAAANATVITNCAMDDRCTLDELFNAGGEIQVRDKLFTSWELVPLDPFTTPPDLGQIEVLGLDDGGNDPGPGIRFEGNGELAVQAGQTQHLDFSFRVIALGPQSIIDNSLAIIPGEVTGDAEIMVHEDVFDTGFELLGFKETFAHEGLANLFDEIEFPPQRELIIEKVVDLDASFGGSAELVAFEQRFSQTVPEPGLLALFGAGLAGVGLVRRRRAPR